MFNTSVLFLGKSILAAQLAVLITLPCLSYSKPYCETAFQPLEKLHNPAFLALERSVNQALWAPTKRPFALHLPEDPPQQNGYEAKRDHKEPSVIFLKRSAGAYEKHEMMTARELGRYLFRNVSANFILVTDFNGKSVPLYDGLAIHALTREPIANISLKFPVHHTDPSPKMFFQDIRERIAYHSKRTRYLDNPMAWFFANNGAVFKDKSPSFFSKENIIQRIDHIRHIADLFGLFGGYLNQPTSVTPNMPTVSRPTWLIIDYRKFGFSYAKAMNPEVLREVQYIVDRHGDQTLELWLLWSSEEIIRISTQALN